jgi:hypothetical protein
MYRASNSYLKFSNNILSKQQIQLNFGNYQDNNLTLLASGSIEYNGIPNGPVDLVFKFNNNEKKIRITPYINSSDSTKYVLSLNNTLQNITFKNVNLTSSFQISGNLSINNKPIDYFTPIDFTTDSSNIIELQTNAPSPCNDGEQLIQLNSQNICSANDGSMRIVSITDSSGITLVQPVQAASLSNLTSNQGTPTQESESEPANTAIYIPPQPEQQPNRPTNNLTSALQPTIPTPPPPVNTPPPPANVSPPPPPPMNPSSSSQRVHVKLKLNATFPENNEIDAVIDQIKYEISKLLLISDSRIKLIKLFPGSIYVTFYIYPEVNLDSYTELTKNNNKPPKVLYEALKLMIEENLITNAYQTLVSVDKTYGLNTIDDTHVSTSTSNLIPNNETIIDNLLKDNVSFALYTYAKKLISPNNNSEPILEKVYLTVPVLGNDSCTSNNGMSKFSNYLTKGSVFNLSKKLQYFNYRSTPYNYIDFDKIIYNNQTKERLIESVFYNLHLKYNNYSLSYCQVNCENNSGLCAQEIYSAGSVTKNYDMNNPDNYQIKNLIKFKLESDNSITPYFISLSNSGEEKIYYITNNYSTYVEPDNYKTLVQVPIYNNQEIYYRAPNYIQSDEQLPGYYEYINLPIKNLINSYPNSEIENYKYLSSFSVAQTLVDKNDAYKDYAYSFQIEIISDDDYKELPLN